MEHIPCPVCKTTGGVPVPSDGFTREGSKVRTTGQCPLCWGVGHIPPLEAYKEQVGKYYDQLALHYWECNCMNTHEQFGDITNIHPDLHEYCRFCHTAQDDGKPAVALLVQSWLAELGVEVDIEWVEQGLVDDVLPAPSMEDILLVQDALFQAPVDTSRTDVYVLPAGPRDDPTHTFNEPTKG